MISSVGGASRNGSKRRESDHMSALVADLPSTPSAARHPSSPPLYRHSIGSDAVTAARMVADLPNSPAVSAAAAMAAALVLRQMGAAAVGWNAVSAVVAAGDYEEDGSEDEEEGAMPGFSQARKMLFGIMNR